MTELTDADIDAAMAAGQRAKREELRATTVRYDRKTKRIIVDLNNGSTFAFPPQLAPELARATEDQLAEVEILGFDEEGAQAGRNHGDLEVAAHAGRGSRRVVHRDRDGRRTRRSGRGVQGEAAQEAGAFQQDFGGGNHAEIRGTHLDRGDL